MAYLIKNICFKIRSILSIFKKPTYGFTIVLNSAYYCYFIILEYIHIIKMIYIIKFVNICLSNRKSIKQDKDRNIDKAEVEDDPIVYTKENFKSLNNFEKLFQIFLLILVSLAALLVLFFFLILFIFKCEYRHNPEDHGAKSDNCPIANTVVICLAIALILIYFIILFVKIRSIRKINKICNDDYKDIYNKLKIKYTISSAATFIVFLLVLASIILIFWTTRIRERFMYSLTEKMISAVVWPIPSNYLMIIAASLNIHVISCLNIIQEIINKLPEELDFNPSSLLNLKISKLNDEQEKEALINAIKHNSGARYSQESSNKANIINDSSFDDISEEDLTETDKAERDRSWFNNRVKKSEIYSPSSGL